MVIDYTHLHSKYHKYYDVWWYAMPLTGEEVYDSKRVIAKFRNKADALKYASEYNELYHGIHVFVQ